MSRLVHDAQLSHATTKPRRITGMQNCNWRLNYSCCVVYKWWSFGDWLPSCNLTFVRAWKVHAPICQRREDRRGGWIVVCCDLLARRRHQYLTECHVWWVQVRPMHRARTQHRTIRTTQKGTTNMRQLSMTDFGPFRVVCAWSASQKMSLRTHVRLVVEAALSTITTTTAAAKRVSAIFSFGANVNASRAGAFDAVALFGRFACVLCVCVFVFSRVCSYFQHFIVFSSVNHTHHTRVGASLWRWSFFYGNYAALRVRVSRGYDDSGAMRFGASESFRGFWHIFITMPSLPLLH